MINTDMYLLLGLGVITAILIGYSASVMIRLSQAKQMIEALNSLAKDAQ